MEDSRNEKRQREKSHMSSDTIATLDLTESGLAHGM